MNPTVKIVAVVLGTGMLLWAKMIFQSSQAFHQAEKLTHPTTQSESLLYYQRAIQSYVPLNPYAHKAVLALFDVYEKNKSHDETLALKALETLRSSIYSIRSFYKPYWGWVKKINPLIAHLRIELESKQDASIDVAAETKRFLVLLEKEPLPHVAGVFMVQIGFLGFLASLFGGIWFGFTPQGELQRKKITPWIGGGAVAFGLFVLGLLSA